jgi:peptide deformylase
MSYIVELGDPVLRKPARPVVDVTSNETKLIIEKMVVTLKKERGIGIAAPQIGVDQQVFIVAPNQKLVAPYDDISTGLVVINPTVSFLTDEITHEWEGCLSIPGVRGYIPRQCNIMIEYTNVLGEFKSETYNDFTARIFLHEYDHLLGVVFLDRIEDLKRHLITDGFYNQMMEDSE